MLVMALLFLVAKYGRQIRLHPQSLDFHKRYASAAFYLTLFGIALAEIMARLNKGAHYPTLLWIHLCFAVPFLATLLVVRFGITGVQKALLHKYVAYSCLFMYAGTFFTGVGLLYAM